MPDSVQNDRPSEDELSTEALDQVVGGATVAAQQSSGNVGQDDPARATRRGMMAEGPNERLPPDW